MQQQPAPFRDIDVPFEMIAPPVVKAGILFNSPHSGRHYPRSFLESSRLALNELRRSEDCYVDELFAAVPESGMVLMRANFPRCFVDLNREAYELDPRMFNGILPAKANTRSQRVVGGLGSIPRIVGDQVEIYATRLPVAEALARIEALHRPYHLLLDQALVALRRRFGVSLLIDCHSMPSYAQHRVEGHKADIILGDRFGASADGALVAFIEEQLVAMGYRVRRNQPYAGGYITEHYGRPRDNRHAVQIEINRALYMNELTYEKSPSFAAMAHNMTQLALSLRQWRWDSCGKNAWAAE